jgi:hypothetical protein
VQQGVEVFIEQALQTFETGSALVPFKNYDRMAAEGQGNLHVVVGIADEERSRRIDSAGLQQFSSTICLGRAEFVSQTVGTMKERLDSVMSDPSVEQRLFRSREDELARSGLAKELEQFQHAFVEGAGFHAGKIGIVKLLTQLCVDLLGQIETKSFVVGPDRESEVLSMPTNVEAGEASSERQFTDCLS